MKFSQLQYEKKFSETIPHINIFCPVKLKAKDCVFAKLIYDLRKFYETDSRVKGKFVEFAFLQQTSEV